MNIYSSIVLFLLIFVISCSNIKSVYNKEQVPSKHYNLLNILKELNIGNNQSIIYFTSTFNDDRVKIITDNNIVFDKKLKTIDQLGFAGSHILENNTNNFLIINDKKITLDNNRLKEYKFIYLEKQHRKYIITYAQVPYSFR